MAATPCLNQKDTGHGAKEGPGRWEAGLASAWTQCPCSCPGPAADYVL